MALASFGWEVAERKENYILLRKIGTDLTIPVSESIMWGLGSHGAMNVMCRLDMFGDFYHRLSKSAYSKGEKLMNISLEKGWAIQKGTEKDYGEIADEFTFFEYRLSPQERIRLEFSAKFGSERYRDGVVDTCIHIDFEKNGEELMPYDIQPEEEAKMKNKLNALLRAIGE